MHTNKSLPETYELQKFLNLFKVGINDILWDCLEDIHEVENGFVRDDLVQISKIKNIINSISLSRCICRIFG